VGRPPIEAGFIRDGLISQAVDAVTGHAQGPAPDALRRFTPSSTSNWDCSRRRLTDLSAGSLTDGVAHSGPGTLAREPFCIGINDPLDMLPLMPGRLRRAIGRSQSVRVHTVPRMDECRLVAAAGDRAREAIFNTRPFVIDNVPGLNGLQTILFAGPFERHVYHLSRHAERWQSLGADGIEHRRRGCVAADRGPAALYTATTGDGRDRSDNRSRAGDGDGQMERYRQIQGAGASRAGRTGAVFSRRIRGDAGGRHQVLRYAFSRRG
jgi:hypothetical protein